MIALMIEMTGHTLPTVAMELMSLALHMTTQQPSEILALVYGKEAEEGAWRFAEESGVETLGLVWGENERTGMETGAALGEALKERGVRTILGPHTPSAMEIAPVLAVALGLPLLAGVVGLDDEKGEFYRSAGGGKTRLHIAAPESAVITIQPGLFDAAHRADRPGSVTFVTPSSPKGPIELLSTRKGEVGTSNLSGARVVVSVGRGIETQGNLPLFTRLADAIPGAAKGCSRPLVDMGWMPYPCQVGITGSSVSADLYIALGISGSSQHLAGIPQSTTVISVGRDPNAAIHAVSDLIIEADLLPFMEATLALLYHQDKSTPPAAR
ncbi:electron transfer flavoprotein subunit alpha [Desulfoluna limicola]|uniref:Electron transfer flavoprotein subunit alpha n=1 Tax=Desulfoluna limicola TaxID=2810562 RepID=A0ABN6F6F5_9BACT|nr:electron transfer flavoprotein subunit alpha/FixB family protein [Desulfoluna limicola]BCS97947.1 electron transfer flavoprotein subunit alpha [Desulfoluna limicola]